MTETGVTDTGVTDTSVTRRSAWEALRAGVPNRVAVSAMCSWLRVVVTCFTELF